MSGRRWIKRQGATLARTPILLTEPPAPTIRVFLDERALARWLAQGEAESDPRLPPVKRRAG